jgi:hypothetical protein
MIASLKNDERDNFEESVDALSDIELKVRLSLRGLKITGIKKVLQDRLQGAYARKTTAVNNFFKAECAMDFEDVAFNLQSSLFNKIEAIRMPEEFSSYEELKDFTSDLIKSIGCCKSLKSTRPDEYIYFRAPLQQHPHAERKKVALISDIRFPKISQQSRDSMFVDYQITIVTSDGDEDTISWIKSIRKREVDENLGIERAIQNMRLMEIKRRQDYLEQHIQDSFDFKC